MNNVVKNDEIADTEVNVDSVSNSDLDSLLKYISENIMHYPYGTVIPDNMKKSVYNTASQMKMYKSDFSYADLLSLFVKYQTEVDYCLSQMTFNNEMHKLNTALKVVKNKVVKFCMTNKHCASEIADKVGINIPLFDGDTEELRERLKQRCGYDDDRYNLVIASLVNSYLEGKIRIIGY